MAITVTNTDYGDSAFNCCRLAVDTRSPPLDPSYRLTTAGIQFKARRDSRVVALSPSYCDTAGTEVKAVRSFKQFTFTTARVPASVSQTAAM